jgi:hypothetical protein
VRTEAAIGNDVVAECGVRGSSGDDHRVAILAIIDPDVALYVRMSCSTVGIQQAGRVVVK